MGGYLRSLRSLKLNKYVFVVLLTFVGPSVSVSGLAWGLGLVLPLLALPRLASLPHLPLSKRRALLISRRLILPRPS